MYFLTPKNLLKISCLLALSVVAPLTLKAQNLTRYVDPFIGTGGHGHTYPGATVPFGMVQLSPDNGSSGWDWSSGYHQSDTVIAGFSHMHLSGTGIGDWSDISVLPHTRLIPDTTKMFRVGFQHADEFAEPGFYSVKLSNGVKASFTASERVGFHQYEFPQGIKPVIRFDLGFKINSDNPTLTYIKRINDSTIVGFRFSDGWSKNQRVFFAARTSVAFKDVRLVADLKQVNLPEAKGKVVKAQLVFDDTKGSPILMKVGLSSVSSEKALSALQEISGWNFTVVREQAKFKWEKELQRFTIKTSDERMKRVFYTALYHTNLAPVLYSDNDGSYRNANNEVSRMPTGQRYTVYSLWDTFRAQHPLLTLIHQDRYPDIVKSMMQFYRENGKLPVWDLNTWETNTMTGYHAVPVLADAVMKNIPGLNVSEVFQAMLKSAYQDIRGTKDYITYGYLPQDKLPRSASITLEYGFDDWCIAQVAKKLGRSKEYATFMKRSEAYKHLFDQSTGFIRAKNSYGTFVQPFDPYHSEHESRLSYYVEGNAWQHSFFVPHDIRGLAKLYGSNDKLAVKLDSLFSVSSVVKGDNASADITGLIGQYAHGNEPSHHIAYMYNYLGQAWKTQKLVRKIVDSLYTDDKQGYSGNEDCGQMSAWAVWSIAGLYPVNPANGEYVFGSPMVDEAEITLPGHKKLIICAINNSKTNLYIQKVFLNGKLYAKTYIDHATILKGGKIEFYMDKIPNKTWGKLPASWPASTTN